MGKVDLAATVAAASSGAHFYGDWDEHGEVKMRSSFLESFESCISVQRCLWHDSRTAV